MNKFKATIKILLIILLLYHVVYNNLYKELYKVYDWNLVDYGKLQKDTMFCGVIIDKLQPERIDPGKYSAHVFVDQVFVINTGNNIKSLEVGSDSYYKYKVGDKVCFNETISIDDNMANIIENLIIVIVTTILSIFVVVVIIVQFIRFLFYDKDLWDFNWG